MKLLLTFLLSWTRTKLHVNRFERRVTGIYGTIELKKICDMSCEHGRRWKHYENWFEQNVTGTCAAMRLQTFCSSSQTNSLSHFVSHVVFRYFHVKNMTLNYDWIEQMFTTKQMTVQTDCRVFTQLFRHISSFVHVRRNVNFEKKHDNVRWHVRSQTVNKTS